MFAKSILRVLGNCKLFLKNTAFHSNVDEAELSYAGNSIVLGNGIKIYI